MEILKPEGIREITCPIGSEIDIFDLSDIHKGHASHDNQSLLKAIEIIRKNKEKNPYTYWLSKGDNIDAIIIKDKRFNPTEVDPEYKIKDLKDLPRKQADALLSDLEPIKDCCIAFGIGNHEESYISMGSFDVYDYMARHLGGDDIKFGYSGYMYLKITTHETVSQYCSFYMNHGSSGSFKTQGHPLNKMDDTFKNRVFDFCLIGHMHKLKDDRVLYVQPKSISPWLEEFYSLRGASGCFLLGEKIGCRNYAEPKGGYMSDIGLLHLRIIPDTHTAYGSRVRYLRKEINRIYMRY